MGETLGMLVRAYRREASAPTSAQSDASAEGGRQSRRAISFIHAAPSWEGLVSLRGRWRSRAEFGAISGEP